MEKVNIWDTFCSELKKTSVQAIKYNKPFVLLSDVVFLCTVYRFKYCCKWNYLYLFYSKRLSEEIIFETHRCVLLYEMNM